MARPLEDVRVKVNGSSLQVLRQGEYVGSIGLKELCQLVVSKRRDGTRPDLVQPKYIKNGSENGGNGTNSVTPLSEPDMGG